MCVCHKKVHKFEENKKCKQEEGLNNIKCYKLFKVIRFGVNQQAIKVKATPNKKPREKHIHIKYIYIISIDDCRLITQFDAEKFAQSDEGDGKQKLIDLLGNYI